MRRKSILLVRIDNRVGEALLLTPVVDALRALSPAPRIDVLVHPRCIRVLDSLPGIQRLIAYDKRDLRTLREVRDAGYDVVIDCGNWTEPSVSSAIVSRLVGAAAAVIGPSTPSVERLRTHPVTARGDTRSEVEQRLHLLTPLLPSPAGRMFFREPKPSPEIRKFIDTLGPAAQRWVVINPGGRLGWRRVPEAVFAAAARAALAQGALPIVSWGPGEEALCEGVLASAPGSVRAPPTSLDDLAWLMAGAQLTVCNNTGPMHLSVAVGTPTLGLFLFMDRARWGHPQAPHVMLDLTDDVERPERMAERVSEETDAMLAKRRTS